MKEKLSVTVDTKLMLELDEILLNESEENFRNKSHLVETAIKKYLKEIENGRK